MKLLTRVALDIKQGARWAQAACLLIAILASIAANVLIWTHDLPWPQLGLVMAVTLALVLAAARYIG